MEKFKADIEEFIIRNRRPIKIWGLVLICSLMVLKGIIQIPQIKENREQISRLQDQIKYEEIRQSNIDELAGRVSSDEYIEKIASEKLGLVKANAKIFVDISDEQK